MSVDERALTLDAFIERYDHDVRNFFVPRVNYAHEDADDCTQDVWVNLTRHRATFESLSNRHKQLAYAFRAANYRLTDYYRRRAMLARRFCRLPDYDDDGNGSESGAERAYALEVNEAIERQYSGYVDERALCRLELADVRERAYAWASTDMRVLVATLYLRGLTPIEMYRFLTSKPRDFPIPSHRTIKNMTTFLRAALHADDAATTERVEVPANEELVLLPA